MNCSRWGRLSGVGLLLLGSAVIFGWLTHRPAWIQLLPGADSMPYSSAVGFVLTGLLLLSLSLPLRNRPATGGRVDSTILAYLLVLLGVGALLEWQLGIRLGLTPDYQTVQQWSADPNPFAGRMRPWTALGFVAIGGVALLLPRCGKVWALVSAQLLVLWVFVVGGLGVFGHLASINVVFGWLFGPVLATGGGFLLAGFGLAILTSPQLGYRQGESTLDGGRIGLIAGAIVVVTGLGGILGGFAVLAPLAAGELQNNLALSLKHRTDLLQAAIQQGWRDADSFGNQPLRLTAMAQLNEHPHNSKLRGEIQAVAERYRAFGFDGVVFRDMEGREIAQAGTFAVASDLNVAIATPTPSRLLWREGFVLHTQVDMIESGRRIGYLETERRLQVGTQINERAPFGNSLDFAICAAHGRNMDCFPMHSTAGKVLHEIPTSFVGRPLPMSHALAGETGIVQTMDYRGIPVIAAYTPLGTLGLGAVLKIDGTELYQPIARRLGPLFVMLFMIATAAVILVRIQVVPMARGMAREIEERKRAESQLEESRETLAEITATLGEGVCVLDEHGIVTYLNPEAERLVGWSASELIGQNAHDALHSRQPDGSLLPSSRCPIILAIRAGLPYRSLSDWFARRDGTFLPVSIIARPIFHDSQVKGAVLSFEDISERKHLEESQARLGASLRRLNEIAAFSHLPLIEQFRRALSVGAEHLGLELGIVSRIEGKRYEIFAQVSPPETLADGQVFPFDVTYCSLTLAQPGVLAISHMGSSAYLGHPCYREFKLESYIGAAIVVGDAVFGTVNFSSPQPYHRGFDDGDREFVALLARWAGSAIERHQTTEAIRQNERRIRALLDASDESVLLLAPDSRILAINAFGAQRFGETPETMVGDAFLALLPEDIVARRREMLAQVVTSGAPVHYQDHREGIFFDNSLYPVKDTAGQVESVAVYAKDVTKTLRSQLVEDIFHSLGASLLKGRVGLVSLTQNFCEKLLPAFGPIAAWVGQIEEGGRLTILGRAGDPQKMPDGDKGYADMWREASDGIFSEDVEIRNGHSKLLHIDATDGAGDAEALLLLPLNMRGEGWGMLGVYAGQNLLEKAQQSLESIASRLGSVLESALRQEWLTLFDSALAGVSNAVLITDADTRILWANQALADLTGFATGDLIGQTPRLFQSGVQDDDLFPSFWATLQAGQPWRGEIVNVRRDGSRYTASETVTPLLDTGGRITHYVAVFEDISERKAIEARIRHAADFDSLTELPNRGLFFDRLAHALAQARRAGHTVALLFLDLDRFKEVNDTLGHEAGDHLLKAVAERLAGLVRESDTVARLAGDEFTVILPRVASANSAVLVAEKFIAALAQPFSLGESQAHIGVSIGVALFPDHGEDVEQVLGAADKAMYQAKAAGRHTVRVYS